MVREKARKVRDKVASRIRKVKGSCGKK